MTREEFIEIFENTDSEWEGDNCFQGLQIISKYTPDLIQGASHDKVFSEDIRELIQAGITQEDVTSLAKLNWSIDDDYLYCFV